MLTLCGIPNCDTVKKAKKWLTEHDKPFEFVDFKKQMPSEETVLSWLEHVPLETLLNKKGTTWRKLDAAAQVEALSSTANAVRLMVSQPSIIKRPVLLKDGAVYVGFSEQSYTDIFTV